MRLLCLFSRFKPRPQESQLKMKYPMIIGTISLPFIYFMITIPNTIEVNGEELASNVTTINYDNVTEVENVTTISSSSKNNENESINAMETQLPNVTNLESNTTSRAIDTTITSIIEDVNSTLENKNTTDNNVKDYESIDNVKEEDTNPTEKVTPECSNLNNANDYIDDIIEEITKNSSGEAKLPSKFGFFILTDGKIWGLSDMQRVGHVEIFCANSSRILNGVLRFKDLKAKYNWRRNSLLSTVISIISWKGQVKLLIDKIDVNFEIKQNNSGSYLDYFKISNISGIRTEITGLTYLTGIISRFTDYVINNFRRTVGILIEGPLKQAFSMEIRRYNFPRF